MRIFSVNQIIQKLEKLTLTDQLEICRDLFLIGCETGLRFSDFCCIHPQQIKDGVLEVSEEVKVKLVEIDKKTGKFRLSRKVLLPKPERKETSASE